MSGLSPQETALHLLAFAKHVVKSFLFEKKGLILAGAVAYNTLLSLIPLLVILLVILTHVLEEERVMAIVTQELELIAPGQQEVLADAVRTFLDNRDLVGWIGGGVLLFLSSIAFRILEDAVGVIFHRTDEDGTKLKRKFWISFLIPYAYMLVFGAALVVLTGLTSIIQEQEQALGWLLYLAGLFGLVALFTSIYKVLPVGKISSKRALAGGVTAAVLWELTRRVLAWYFANLSLVNVVYGGVATVIIVLVTFEIGAIILLLGAEVIAELEDNANAGLPWYGKLVAAPVVAVASQGVAVAEATGGTPAEVETTVDESVPESVPEPTEPTEPSAPEDLAGEDPAGEDPAGEDPASEDPAREDPAREDPAREVPAKGETSS